MADTPIHFSYVKPTPDGDVPVLNAKVRFALLNRENVDGKIRITDSFEVEFPTGEGTVLLSPTSANQAWQILERSPITKREDVTVLVPPSVVPVEFYSLTRVDESSFEVTTTPDPAWVASLDGLDARVDVLEALGGGPGGSGAVASVNGKTGIVVISPADITETSTRKWLTDVERTKLSGVATGATANQTDSTTNAAISAKYTKPGTGIPSTDLDTAVQTSLAKADSSASTSAVAFGDTTTLSQAKAYTDSNLYTLSLDVTAKYTKPGTGIPASDLTSAVQASLGKADTALQAAPVLTVAGRTGAVTLTADDTPDGVTNKAYTASEKTKLSGIASGATVNRSDASTDTLLAAKAPLASPAFTGTPTGITAAHVGLGNVNNTADASKPVSTAQASADAAVQAAVIQRANHTGTQSADTLIDGTTNKAFLATERTKLTGIATGATVNQSDATTNAAIALKADLVSPALTGTPTAPTATGGTNTTQLATTAFVASAISGLGGGTVTSVNTQSGAVVLTQDNIADGTTAKQYTATEKTKLAGIATAATANQTDAVTNAAIAAKYTKPGTGITTADLAASVVTSLGKADTALQSAPVTTVAGRTGAVTLTADDVPDGTTNKAYTATEKTKLAGVASGATANQSDATTNAAIALKAPLASPAFTGTPTGITATHVGLGNVTNTSDAAKPVSTAQQSALDLKQDIATLTETVQDIVGAFLVQGTNVVLTYDDVANSLTINSTGGGGGGLDLETVQDAVAAMVLPSGTGLTKTYDDTAGTLTLTLDLSTKQDASAALTALAALATNGSIHRTAANTYVSRTLTGSTNILVTNGDGVAGNPTVAIQSTISVANGGSGRATGTTAYGLVAVGTTATGAQQTVAPGTSGMFLKSAGAAALAAFASITEADVTNLVTDLGAKAPLASPTLTGVPAAPTATAGTNTTQLATTAFVTGAVTTGVTGLAPLASPAFTGTPTGITKAHVGLGSVDNTADSAKPVSTAQAAADTAVQAAAVQRANHTGTQTADTITDGTTNKAYTAVEKTKLAGIATGATANQSDATTNAAIALKSDLASPTFTGVPAAPTATAATSTTQIATTAFVTTADNLKANIASPTFTGTVGGITKAMVGLGSVDNTADTAKPVSTAQQTQLDLKAPLASPTLTGNPTAPTPTAGDNDTSIATTAFVTTAVAPKVGSDGSVTQVIKLTQAAYNALAPVATTLYVIVG